MSLSGYKKYNIWFGYWDLIAFFNGFYKYAAYYLCKSTIPVQRIIEIWGLILPKSEF